MPESESIEARAHRTRRVIEASPATVFAAISDPQRLARWWGPDGFSSTFETFSCKTAGRWDFTMHGPDGVNYPNRNVFLEVVPGERVVVEHLSDEHHFILTISLAKAGEGTEVGWLQVFDTREHFQSVASFVAAANEQNLQRLAAEVARMRSDL